MLGTSFLKGTRLSIKVNLNAFYSYLSPERLCTSLRLLHTLWFTLYHGSLEKKNESVEDSGRKELRQEWKAVRLPPTVALESALVCWTGKGPSTSTATNQRHFLLELEVKVLSSNV